MCDLEVNPFKEAGGVFGDKVCSFYKRIDDFHMNKKEYNTLNTSVRVRESGDQRTKGGYKRNTTTGREQRQQKMAEIHLCN